MARTASAAVGSARSVVTFDDFSGGEYGLLGGTHAPKGSFTGTNVVRLLDGSLCPRSGLVDVAPTGVPTGVVLGFGYYAAKDKVWFIVGNKAYDFPINAGLPPGTRTLSGTFALTSNTRIQKGAQGGDYTYVTILGDKSYSLAATAGAVGALTGSPEGRAIAIYGDRLLVAGPTGNPHRVYYSAAADFNSWPVANYFDVGYLGSAVAFLSAFRERVVIAQQDGTWSILSGVPGVNDVLRRMLQSLSVGTLVSVPTRAGSSGDGKVWFLPELGDYPTQFTGSGIQTFEHLSLTNDEGGSFLDSTISPLVGATGLLAPEDFFFNTGVASSSPYNNQGLLFHAGVWSKHVFTKNLSGWIDGRYDQQRRVVFCDGGSVGAAAKFYVWSYGLQRPPISGNEMESIGDASSSTPVAASFSYPEWWTHDGSEVLAQAVAVDFKKWNHGYSPSNAFTVTLTPKYRDGGSAALAGGDGTAVTVGSFSEAASASSASGTLDRRRWTLPVSVAFANGFQVSVSGLVGCAIKKVHVFYDARPAQAV